MNSAQFFLKLVLASVCLVLAAAVIVTGQSYLRLLNAPPASQAQPSAADKSIDLIAQYRKSAEELRELQTSVRTQEEKDQAEMQKLQADINRGIQMQTAYSNIIKAIAGDAYDTTGKVKNEKLAELLKRNGWSLTPSSTAQP